MTVPLCWATVATYKKGYPQNFFLISPHNICFCGEIRKISVLLGDAVPYLKHGWPGTLLHIPYST